MSAPDDAVRLRELERSAARREPIHWQKVGGEPVLVDRHHRTLAQVQAELALVLDLIEQLTTIVAAVETRLTAGRTYGPALPRRLRSSCESLLKAARRDEGIAAALEEAWRDEQEKRAR